MFNLLGSILLYVSICTAKITVPRDESKIQLRMINSAAEIANFDFNFRKLTVFLSYDVENSAVNLFLQLYQGTVVVETKKDGTLPGQVVVIVDSFKTFMKIMGKLKPDLKGRSLLGSGAKFLIVLLGNPRRIDHIMSILWNYRATNALVAVNEANKTAIYTYFPYKNHLDCQNTDARLIGYWKDDKKLLTRKLYLDKMENMKGCPLYVSTNKLYHPSTEQKIPLQVVKKALLRLLRDIMNFTPIISTRDYVSIDSDRAKNWSDSLNDVIGGFANISTCSIPLGIDRLGLLDYSMPYSRVQLAWLAPPVSPGPVWWRLLSPLNGYLWLVLLVVLFLITSLPFLLKVKAVKKFCFKYFRNINKLQGVTIRIWGVLLGQPIRVAPKRFRDFYILSLWIWFTFVIRSVYQSVLIGALKTDTLTGAFLDLREAIDHGYRFGGRAGVYAYFEHDPFIKEHFLIVKDDDFEECLFDIVERRTKFVLASSLEYAWAYCLAQGKKEMECGHVLPDSIMTVPLAIWMKIHSPFKKPIAIWLPRLIESGLLDRESRLKPVCCLTTSTDPTPLTRHQTLSCLLLLFIGYSISAAVFVLEVFRHKTKEFKSKFILNPYCIQKKYPFRD